MNNEELRDELLAISNSQSRIYVYFKKLEEGLSLDKSVLDFMNELDNNLHYYWSNFTT